MLFTACTLVEGRDENKEGHKGQDAFPESLLAAIFPSGAGKFLAGNLQLQLQLPSLISPTTALEFLSPTELFHISCAIRICSTEKERRIANRSPREPQAPARYQVTLSQQDRKMHLMYTEDPSSGKRIYTLKKVLDGVVTKSAHPARFSPDDKYSRYDLE